MKKAVLTIAASALVAASAFAADAMKSGLKPGTSVPAFQVVDVSGPNKGKQLCYRCSYGGSPVVAAFIKSNPAEASELVAGLQQVVDQHKKVRSFVVFMKGQEAQGSIAKLAAEKKVAIPLTFLPEGPGAEDIRQYQINPEAQNTILLWNRGKVQANFVNASSSDLAQISRAVADMVK